MIIDRETINLIVTRREPLSKYANKIYETVKDAGGFIKTWNITFSRAIGLTSTGQTEFMKYLDECIEKDYVRVMFTDGREKNGFFTLEYFYLEVLQRLQQRNSEVYQFHIEYIEQKLGEARSETGLH